jgi:hypothetical protein
MGPVSGVQRLKNTITLCWQDDATCGKRANRNPDGSRKRPEVDLDETVVNKNHSGQFTWYLEEDGPWVNKPSGKGPRLIIVHAMTLSGWVQGAELVFEAAKRTGDYHGQMNWENFSTWFLRSIAA